MASEDSTPNAGPLPGPGRPRAGLVLTGGGARAAYQVGVIKAVREILGNPVKNPFPILCGTSAGAINAATLAAYADDFNGSVERLLEQHGPPIYVRHHIVHNDVKGANFLATDKGVFKISDRCRLSKSRCSFEATL